MMDREMFTVLQNMDPEMTLGQLRTFEKAFTARGMMDWTLIAFPGSMDSQFTLSKLRAMLKALANRPNEMTVKDLTASLK